MRFRALPVTDLEDVTLDLEQLSARAILDKTPNNFLQLLSTQQLQLQAGQATVALTAGVFTNFALPTAWTTSHLAFIATLTPGAAGNFTFGAATNGTGAANLWFNGTNGAYVMNWLSLGH